MSDAPKRIWFEPVSGYASGEKNRAASDATQYIRKSIVDDLVKALAGLVDAAYREDVRIPVIKSAFEALSTYNEVVGK